MERARLNRMVQKYGDTVYKIAVVILRNPDDADDALQETFLRYFRKAPEFESSEHEKAWIIRCATHVAKGMLRSNFRHKHEPLRENLAAAEYRRNDLPEMVLQLPLKERMILQLHYVEGYTAEEIAKMMSFSSAATVRKRMERARKKLKELYDQQASTLKAGL